MALPNVTRHIIATGASVQVRIGKNTDTPNIVIGLATNASYQENYNLQDAVVLGTLGPVSIDVQGYTCTITIGTFVPSKLAMGENRYDAVATEGILENVPYREDIFSSLPGQKFQSLDFYDKDSGTVLAQFSGAVLSDDGITVEGNAYAKGNVQFRALEKVKI
jgi:hypothetical protein